MNTALVKVGGRWRAPVGPVDSAGGPVAYSVVHRKTLKDRYLVFKLHLVDLNVHSMYFINDIGHSVEGELYQYPLL